jgi:hypothetical protein
LKVTCPLPLPEPPSVTVIHEAFDAAAHVHPAGALTPTRCDPPSAATDWLVESSAYVHGVTGVGGEGGVGGGVGGGAGAAAAAACVTLSVWPATVTVPVRASPAFCRTVKPALPLPVAEADVVSIQATLLAAVHAQAAELAVTATVSGPPAAAIVAGADPTVNRHTAASCATATCASLTPTVPLRGVGSALVAT